jgi:hypothetical protein
MTKRYGHMERMEKRLSKNTFDFSLKGRRIVIRRGKKGKVVLVLS